MPGGLEVIRSQMQGLLLRSMSALLGTPSSAQVVQQSRGRRVLGPQQPSAFDQLIAEVAERHDVDPTLVKAMIKIESNFDPSAVSHAGAKGLMQLMDGTAEMLGVTDSFDPIQNVEGGVKFIKFLLGRYQNDETLALAAYNAGPGAVDRYQGIPPYEETQKYVTRVLQVREAFCNHLA
jgi:soluble lytic murein transglycosylase-like protein